jgi:hypothetical protein
MDTLAMPLQSTALPTELSRVEKKVLFHIIMRPITKSRVYFSRVTIIFMHLRKNIVDQAGGGGDVL